MNESDASDRNPFKIELPTDPFAVSDTASTPDGDPLLEAQLEPPLAGNAFDPMTMQLVHEQGFESPEPVQSELLDSSNPFEPAPGELAALPSEFETPGVAAAIESATPAFATSEELIEPETPYVAEAAAPIEYEPGEPLAEQTEAPAEAEKPKAMENVRSFSDNVGVGEIKASVPAAFPFSLLIEGKFDDYARAKFLDLFAREDLGFREIDLEPQLGSGRVLIPRISEYAGVLLVQTLRNLPVKMRLGPAAEIYNKDTSLDETTNHLEIPATVATLKSLTLEDALHLPITTEETLPQFMSFEVIDTITVSATLKSDVVEANLHPDSSQSAEFQRVIERLQRDLRHRAHAMGAHGVIRFKTDLTPLSMASHYRVIVTGVAVRPDHPNPYQEEGTVPSTLVDPDLTDPLADPLMGEPGLS